jgi:hypothetical protein
MAIAGAKRLMDVEDVVRWACGSELIKRRGAPSPDLRAGMALSRADASLVGRWSWPPGFPPVSPMFALGVVQGTSGRAASGPPDGDALIVEAAILALPGRACDWTAPEALALDIGLPVDVDGAFAAAAANIVALVTMHGRLASRPTIGPETPRPVPRLAPNGKPGAWRKERWREPTIEEGWVERDVETPVARMRRDSWPDGAYGVLEWDPDPQLIVNDRAEYCAWRLALEALAEALSDRMERVAALAPAAALAPWLGEADAGRIPDLFGPGAERVYSGRERLALEARRASRARREVRLSGGKARRPARPGRGAASA